MSKRKVYYDRVLAVSIAYVTAHWDEVCEDRYIKYCTDEWKSRGIYHHMLLKLYERKEPITLWMDFLDRRNLELTIEFLLHNEHAKDNDEILELDIDI